MKKVILLVLLLAPVVVFSQTSAVFTRNTNMYPVKNSYMQSDNEGTTSIKRVGIWLNPLGFLQFGPVAGVEFRLNENMAVNVHTRVPSLGVLSYLIREDVEKITGFCVGGGFLYFFGTRQHKPYAGIMFEYEQDKCLYDQNESDANTETEKIMVFIMNGGYRFNFSKGFFLNTGLFVGAVKNNWYEDYDDPSYTDYEGTLIQVFGMLEVAVGIAF